MNSTRAVRWSLPPLILVPSYLAGIIAARMGHDAFMAVHVPLELMIVGSMMASLYVTARMLADWKNPELRWPLILNGITLMTLAASLWFGRFGAA